MSRIGDSLGRNAGFTLVEILIALVIFSILAVGALAAVGATNSGGFLEGFPVAFSTTRSAKDITAATTYLQALQEYLAALGPGGVTPDTYCAGSCGGETPLPAGYPTPSSRGMAQSYQLDWTTLIVVIERYGWDDDAGQYVPTPGCTGDCLTRVESTLTWRLKDAMRTVTMERFLVAVP
jgi:prepilin-type N-terminal cleavage/methylation domain-containing protein